ncbi:MAG: hypothetical protein Q7U88_10435 [Desulfocapsaceae bacterium]|nr:hypothetical protein [Desulfocapsaceae bacterium]
MKIKQSKFFCGQKVIVIEGTKDPDYDSDIGGWTGCIEEIFLSEENNETWLYMILWDQQTLKRMGRNFRQRCEKDNLDDRRMTLEESELMALLKAEQTEE